jgi:glycosyltransferase involved in cell wall biosynthesis
MATIDSRQDAQLHRSDEVRRRSTVKVAYLINQYPMTSLTFIRREIAAIEALGHKVPRYAIRRWDEKFVDPLDEAEFRKTRVILDIGVFRLVQALVATMMGRPGSFLKALRLAVQMGRRSERGSLVHLIYLVEACVLLGWFSRDQIEHVHIHFGSNPATVALLCRTLGGPPYSFTVHGPEEFDRPQSLALGEKIRRSAFAVAISEFGRSQLCRWVSHDQWPKIRVVRCGVDALFLQTKPSPPPAGRRFVCVGRLAEQKGQLILIEAAAQLQREGIDFELILAGDGPMRSEIERLIDLYGLSGRVKLVGWQTNKQVYDLIRNSRAMVLPSFAEGLPVVIMEALALGRPVISTYVAGIPELVLPGETGWLIPASSVGALAAAMRQALDAPIEVLDRMGRAGADRVAQYHDIRRESDKLLDLFEQSANPARRTA